MTRGVKVPCATVTPSGKTDLADLTVSHFALATRVADVERIRDQSGRATADESGPETRREREPFLFVQCKLKPTSGESCPEKSNLDQHERRALEQTLYFGEVLGGDGPIHHTMVGTNADGHALSSDDGVAGANDGLFENRPDADDDGLWRIDDRVEELDSVSAEVGDGDGSALVLIGFQFFTARACREIFDRLADVFDRTFLGVADDRGDETVIDGDGNGKVHGTVLDDGIASE